jgi:hypothetical protein
MLHSTSATIIQMEIAIGIKNFATILSQIDMQST